MATGLERRIEQLERAHPASRGVIIAGLTSGESTEASIARQCAEQGITPEQADVFVAFYGLGATGHELP